MAQQCSADLLGMYLFLASEIMLFGGLFVVLVVLRVLHPQDVIATSKEFHYWIGALNTAILLTSSFFVAVAVNAVKGGTGKGAAISFIAAALLGVGFLGMKVTEYMLEYREGTLPFFGDLHAVVEPAARLFLNLYLIATFLHAAHVAIGIGLLSIAAVYAHSSNPRRRTPVEILGLYWHFVDIVWIFLYPLLYLAR